jgi:hypothetical protein
MRDMTSIDTALTIGLWVGAVLIGLNLVVSGLVFHRRRHVCPGLRKLDPRRWAVYNGLWWIFTMTLIVPALVHVAHPVRQVLAVVGLVSCIAAVIALFLVHERPAGVVRGGTATGEPETGSGWPRQAD